MQETEKRISIALEKPLSDATGKLVWESIELHEPALIEVHQFYEEQKKNGALSAVGLLISLLSAIPVTVVKGISYTRFKQSEAFLLAFLNFTPDTPVSDGVPDGFASIVLARRLEESGGKQAWASVELSEPTLEQVDRFYKLQEAKGGLTAMANLISELSGIPVPLINRLSFTDYKRCEGYLLVFLNYSPESGAGGI